MPGLIRKIIKFSAVDGPGNRSAIFFQGCNMNCVYCHNPETIAASSGKAALMTVDGVFAEIGASEKYIRGITVTGGECMIQQDFVLELFKAAKNRGLTTFIDTNGLTPIADGLLEHSDGVMLDIKSSDDTEHKALTGASNKNVLKSMKNLADCEKLYEVRTVLSEDLLDCERTVDFVSCFIGNYRNIRYKLIKYRPFGVRKRYVKNITVPSMAFMEKMKCIAHNRGVNDVVIV